MITYMLMLAIVILTLYCAGYMVFKYRQQQTHPPLSYKKRIQLMCTGVVAFFADGIGLGSFAVNTALVKSMRLLEDKDIPGLTNGAQVIPGALASLFFMHIIPVHYPTLITLVLGTCVGGVLGGYFVSHLSQQKIRFCMMFAFTGVACMLLAKQLGMLPQDGHKLAFEHFELIFGFFAMAFCGALTSVGIGLFAMTQAVLFMMNASPEIAFPIMTTAGAMQQPLTTLVFLKRDKVPLQETLTISLAGCLGTLAALPLIHLLSAHWLHRLLLIIMIYNTLSISQSYIKTKKQNQASLQPAQI